MNSPQNYDINEWFIIIGLLVSILLIILLPKRFPHTISTLILMFCMVIPIILDTMIATKPFDFYDINDTSKFELFDFLLWFFYAPFGYFFLYGFDKWNLRSFGLLIYIIVSSMLAVGFEFITIKAHIFTFDGWHLFYSFPIYLVVQSAYIAFYLWIKTLFHQTKLSDLIYFNKTDT
ncbi:hypothetical protein M3175_09810 [Robertmurraya korlensis]|uniref:hypothetical protein n=1 Tax=Robertmurraya korlensis TaxID=519977 RepID=UPI00203E79D8|nr:hypothetical protein [Robertmurraya korlensis]MCM3601026.1 hypothetical protein [Robertmurraya korlensis]